MVSSSTLKLSAKAIAALTDEELCEHLGRNYGFVLVQDPENLPDGFIEKLKYFSLHPNIHA